MSKPAGNNVKLSIIAAVLVGLLAIVTIPLHSKIRFFMAIYGKL